MTSRPSAAFASSRDFGKNSAAGYPLSALVGQSRMFQGLVFLAVDPGIGGLLLVGEKGTAKSTAARALAEIMPLFPGRDCPYHCRTDLPEQMCPACRDYDGPSFPTAPPFRTVPLGVSEERLLGGLDWEATLKNGRPVLRPGILGEANRGLVYVDEINLLEPSLAHLLLDASSSGRVVVERDGLSLWHPARFALLGSMNPEEGPLGPQLADRFTLTVRLTGERDPAARLGIVERRLEYERDPALFRSKHAGETEELKTRIVLAREALALLKPGPPALRLAAELAREARAAGHRADLGLCLAARALAAWEAAGEIMRLGPGTFAAAASVGTGLAGHDGNSRAEFFGNFPAGSAGTRPVDLAGIQPAGLAGNAPADSAGTVAGGRLPGGTVAGWLRENPGAGEVGEGHVDRVAGYVVPERLRRPRPVHARAAVDKTRRAEAAEAEARPSRVLSEPEIPPDFSPEAFDPDEEIRLTVYDAAESFELTTPKVRKEFGNKERSGRRSFRETLKTRGRAYKTTARRLGRPLSLSATLRAAAPRQGARREAARPAGVSGLAGRSLILKPVDFREKVYRLKTGRLVVFVVDSSGSVGTLYRMEEAKAAALALLAEAYRKRDRVALIAFYGYSAELLLPPTNSPDLAGRLLSSLPSGGKTPMAAALAMTHRLILTERSKDPKISPYVILMTDGRPNIPLDKSQQPWAEVLSMAGHMAQDPTVRFLLVDTDRGAYNDYKLTRELAERLGCPRLNLEELREGKLEDWFEVS